MALSKDKELITQYDGPNAEMCGLLKMDFLGLETLSILKTAIRYVERNYGRHYELDEIPFDDETTFELYQKGNTVEPSSLSRMACASTSSSSSRPRWTISSP
ncbi:MAG: hypothetical protein U5K31_05325 [Balneolaceae bacterium]|nr:hypothetical protein [Balneolaceae bacterium]